MTLALIAGNGHLPAAVAGALETPPVVCVFEGAAPEGLAADLTFRLETLGSLLVALGERGVTEVCFAGGIDRPAIDPDKLDAETAPLVPILKEALAKGDDGALTAVVELFERTGFIVRGAHELAPDLMMRGGVLGEAWPDAQMRRDGEVGAAHIAEMAPRDIGQSCLVAEGRVRGMEDRSGTDSLIAAHGPALRGKRGILFKGPKPGQNRLVDLPTIGPDTIRAAVAAGLAGVVTDADDVLILDRDTCRRLADEGGLVVWARTGE
jgi:UDP-2,3-diacylglucosamine hydrolase